jgi:hypothetical protein
MMLFLLTLACGQDISVTETARCDGVLQSSEDWVDQPFDKDEDGYPDGGNTECQENYDPADLDCDDNNPDINPSAVEVDCNLLDDDCDADTLDEEDRDEDTYTSCEECDDFNADVNPEAAEISCNNLDDDCNPATADALDLDGDGYTECDLDCDDEDANVNPGMDETLCNGVDDDCSDATSDGDDLDGDGITECTDCDDDDILNFPGNGEVCEDDQDNDCDTLVDESCSTDYSGTWSLDQRVSYECAFVAGNPVVDIDFSSVIIFDTNPNIQVSASAGQPGDMSGAFSSATQFTAEHIYPGGCTETYTFEGEFTGPNTFSGTFTVDYSPDNPATTGGCYDCDNNERSWTLAATR